MRPLVVLVLAGLMLFCLGVSLSLPVSGFDVPPAIVAGADVAHVHRGANAPLPDGSYLFTPAEEVQKTDERPVNAYLLTMLLLACSFGASVGWLLTNSQRQGALCSLGVVRPSLANACKDLPLLGVFRL
jgi:hypothetical protein